MPNSELYNRDGQGGSSNYHRMIRGDRVVSRTYRIHQQTADDIAGRALQLKISSNDFAKWLLEEALQQVELGAITPKVEIVLSRIKPRK